MNKMNFKVRVQNPPLISMLCLLISLIMLVVSLEGMFQKVVIILLAMYIVFFIYKLIWFIRNRKKYLVMELTEDAIKVADEKYYFSDMKKVTLFENYLEIKRHNKRWIFIYFKIKIEDISEIVRRIKEVTKDKDVQIILR